MIIKNIKKEFYWTKEPWGDLYTNLCPNAIFEEKEKSCEGCDLLLQKYAFNSRKSPVLLCLKKCGISNIKKLFCLWISKLLWRLVKSCRNENIFWPAGLKTRSGACTGLQHPALHIRPPALRCWPLHLCRWGEQCTGLQHPALHIRPPALRCRPLHLCRWGTLLKKGNCFCTLAGYCLTYDGWFPQQWEEYFYFHPQSFFASDRPGSPSINKEGIFPGI